MFARILSSIGGSARRPANVDRQREEIFADRRSTFAAVVVLAAGVLLFAMWTSSQTTFENCAAITDYQARIACFEQARRDQEARPPAKGPNPPAGALHFND